MALINITNTPTTPAEKIKAHNEQVLKSAYAIIKHAFNIIKRNVWQNKDLTPQQVFDLYGTDAAVLCVLYLIRPKRF